MPIGTLNEVGPRQGHNPQSLVAKKLAFHRRHELLGERTPVTKETNIDMVLQAFYDWNGEYRTKRASHLLPLAHGQKRSSGSKQRNSTKIDGVPLFLQTKRNECEYGLASSRGIGPWCSLPQGMMPHGSYLSQNEENLLDETRGKTPVLWNSSTHGQPSMIRNELLRIQQRPEQIAQPIQRPLCRLKMP